MYWKTALCVLSCVLLCTNSAMADPGASKAALPVTAFCSGDETGACCFMDGTCEILTPRECFGDPGAWGIWLGPDTTCDMCKEVPPMEDGACCFDDGTCEILDEFACWDAWGF